MTSRASAQSCSGESTTDDEDWGRGACPLTGALSSIGERMSGGMSRSDDGGSSPRSLARSRPTSLPPSYGSRSIRSSSCDHRPVQVGGRFSMKARIPSRWSSVAKSSKKAARSARRPALRDRSAAASTERLAARTASGGIAGDRVGELQRRLDSLGARDDLRDEPGGLRLLGRHRPPGQDELHGQRRADGPGEPLRAAGPGHDPDPDLRLTELGVVAGDDEVARHGQLAAATQGVAADGGDQRAGRSSRCGPRPRSCPRRAGVRGSGRRARRCRHRPRTRDRRRRSGRRPGCDRRGRAPRAGRRARPGARS